jgi:hypothetical protein
VTIDVDRFNIALLNEKLALVQTSIDASAYINYVRLLKHNLIDDYTWRLFKGRLYTRLHDKRIGELNLNAVANLAIMFLSLIESITQPMEPVRSIFYPAPLRIISKVSRVTKAENIIRILNIFEEKSMKSSDATKNDEELLINLKKTIAYKIFKMNLSIKFSIFNQYCNNKTKTTDHGEFFRLFVDILDGFAKQLKSLTQTHKKMTDLNRNQLK